jgi:hypothetical protein
MLLTTERGLEGVLVVEFDRHRLMRFRTEHPAPAAVAEVRLQAEADGKADQHNPTDDKQAKRKERKHSDASRSKSRAYNISNALVTSMQ